MFAVLTDAVGLGNSLATMSWAAAMSMPLLAASKSQLCLKATSLAWARLNGEAGALVAEAGSGAGFGLAGWPKPDLRKTVANITAVTTATRTDALLSR